MGHRREPVAGDICWQAAGVTSEVATDLLTYREAINAALHDEMAARDDVILMGEDVGVFGGVFRTNEGLVERFGRKRVIDTPICENGFLGVALGLSVTGFRPVVEILFADFLPTGADALDEPDPQVPVHVRRPDRGPRDHPGHRGRVGPFRCPALGDRRVLVHAGGRTEHLRGGVARGRLRPAPTSHPAPRPRPRAGAQGTLRTQGASRPGRGGGHTLRAGADRATRLPGDGRGDPADGRAEPRGGTLAGRGWASTWRSSTCAGSRPWMSARFVPAWTGPVGWSWSRSSTTTAAGARRSCRGWSWMGSTWLRHPRRPACGAVCRCPSAHRSRTS